MLNRVSVNALLKIVVTALVAAVMVVLTIGAFESWSRLKTVNRITAVTEASAHMFTALHNLRLDRTFTTRELNTDQVVPSLNSQAQEARAGEMPALKAALGALERIDFAGQKSAMTALDASIKKLSVLHVESAAAVSQPKAQRRPALSKEFEAETTVLIETLEKASTDIARLVKLEDAFVDQLLELKELAWLVRFSGGDASVIVSNGLGSGKVAPDAMLKYTAITTQIDSTWAILERQAAGLKLPARFTDAVVKANQEFFAPDFKALRLRLITALVNGEKPPMTPAQWTPGSVGKLKALLGVADAALEAAMDHAVRQRVIASNGLKLQLGLLAVALVVAIGLMVLISRRVTGPLNVIQHAMLKLAGGDLTAQVSFGDRKDEIGALAGSMQTFKDSMIEADRLRGEQKETDLRAGVQRKTDMERLADEFQSAVGNIVDAVSTASTELERAAGTLTKTAETTQQLSGVVAAASEEASANVNSVASAAEEMSGSVDEIARQVQVSSKIAAEAVQQAQKTDARITELSNAASRIGDVVKLITAIAEQTNLLALNATIEAARAGEAGRGFAVVASEVKALAAQTAKATDEIGTQISSMQNATHESVAAIKEIGGTIGRIADIASAITVAVEQQGAATQEISRNVQQAAMGTAEVAANITDVSRGASETGSASSQVLGSAQSLARDSGRLRAEVEKFVNTVRAA
jgi:methyl-accepting chemotaxis protein